MTRTLEYKRISEEGQFARLVELGALSQFEGRVVVQVVILAESFVLLIDIGQQLVGHLLRHVVLQVVHALDHQFQLFALGVLEDLHLQVLRLLGVAGHQVVDLFVRHVQNASQVAALDPQDSLQSVETGLLDVHSEHSQHGVGLVGTEGVRGVEELGFRVR